MDPERPDADEPSRPSPWSTLRVSHFGALWASNLLQYLGSQVQLFGLQWLVTDLTASRTILGSVTSLQGLTVALSSPAAGVAADRFPRRDLLVLGRLGLVAGIGLMIGLVHTESIALWSIFGFAVLLGLLTALSQPATLAYVFDIVGRHHAQTAVALDSAAIGLGQMAGPALAGVLVAAFGVLGSWWLAAAVLGVAGLLVWRIPNPGRSEPSPHAPLRELREGVAYVFATPPVLLALLVCTMAFFNGAIFAMRPVFARHVLQVGSEGMGLMAACAGLGNLLGAVAATWLRPFRRSGIAMAGSMLGFSTCILLYAFAFSLPYILAVEFASGWCAQMWQVSAFSGLQLSVPEHMRGRVMGLLFTVVQLAQVGGVFVGGLADLVGDQWAMGIFGATPMAFTAILLVVGHRTLGRLGPATTAVTASPREILR